MRSQDSLNCETNSLSLRERARVRGKAACNGQGHGPLPGVALCFPSLRVAGFIGGSQARCFAERFFPITPALSPRRGRTVRRAFANPEPLDSSTRGTRCSLLRSLLAGREKTKRGLLPVPLSPILRTHL